MIETLLSYIKLNNIELRNKFIPQSITEFISSFAKSAEITGNIFKRTVSLNIDFPYDVKIPFDAQLVNRAFENLLSNAIRYTKENDTITLKAYTKDNNLYFIFSDTGIGIDKNDITNIFDIFYRGTNSRREEGMGIGLSVVKNIIDTHGWTISVDSQKNKGTSFIITIPFAQETDSKTKDL